MILPNSKDAVHKAWLYRLLAEICDNLVLANSLYFKGGTCAAMLGYLDRFSVDLDFDFVRGDGDIELVRKNFRKVFGALGLAVKDESKEVPQYFLKYQAKPDERNTIKIDVTMPPPKANKYEAKNFTEIDRVITCQTIETMFANKLVALIDRYEKNESIAGRDVYDIHHFFISGYGYSGPVIKERTGKEPVAFLKTLADFVERHITETIITQDLSVLVPYERFKKIRKTLKREVLMFLRDEIERN